MTDLTDEQIEKIGIVLLLFHGVIIMAEVYLLWESHLRNTPETGGQLSTSKGPIQSPLF